MSSTARVLARPFVAKNNVVLISKAAVRCQAPASSTRTPDLVLVFGWMDAQLNHLHKFTETYHKLYPNADQILIRSYQSQTWSYMFRRRQLHESLGPAVEAIRERKIRTFHDIDPSCRVLVHVLSNGGALQLTTLIKLLNSTLSSYSVQPPNTSVSSPSSAENTPPITVPPSFIFDSTPGHVPPLIMARALTDPLSRSSPLLSKLIFVPAGLTVYLARSAEFMRPSNLIKIASSSRFFRSSQATEISGWKSRRPEKWPFAQIRIDLLNPSIIPPDSRRLYIYTEPRSGIDRLVPGEDVEEHIQELEKVLDTDSAGGRGVGENGMIERRVDRAVHVGHMREDPEGYWNAIRSFWDRSQQHYEARQRMRIKAREE